MAQADDTGGVGEKKSTVKSFSLRCACFLCAHFYVVHIGVVCILLGCIRCCVCTRPLTCCPFQMPQRFFEGHTLPSDGYLDLFGRTFSMLPPAKKGFWKTGNKLKGKCGFSLGPGNIPWPLGNPLANGPLGLGPTWPCHP